MSVVVSVREGCHSALRVYYDDAVMIAVAFETFGTARPRCPKAPAAASWRQLEAARCSSGTRTNLKKIQ